MSSVEEAWESEMFAQTGERFAMVGTKEWDEI